MIRSLSKKYLRWPPKKGNNKAVAELWLVMLVMKFIEKPLNSSYHNYTIDGHIFVTTKQGAPVAQGIERLTPDQ